MPLGVGAQLGIKQSSQMFPEREHLALLPLAYQLGESGGVQLAGCLQKVSHHQQIAVIFFLAHRSEQDAFFKPTPPCGLVRPQLF